MLIVSEVSVWVCVLVCRVSEYGDDWEMMLMDGNRMNVHSPTPYHNTRATCVLTMRTHAALSSLCVSVCRVWR